jgi:hypothetical protein
MVKVKKAPSISPRIIEPDPWSAKIKIKKRPDIASEDDPIGT